MRTIFLLSIPMWMSTSKANPCVQFPGYSCYGSHCYRLYGIAKPWAVAEASCVADGGHLASIHSSTEQAFLASFVSSSSRIWIGISGRKTYTWSDNTVMDYTTWYGSNPDTNGESCGRMKSDYWYRWSDQPCTSSYDYLCKVEPTPATTTSTTTAVTTPLMTTTPLKTTPMTSAPVTTTPMTSTPATTNPMTTSPVSTTQTATPAVSSTQTMDQVLVERRASFTYEPNDAPMTLVFGCARKCLQDVQCVHFSMSEDGGKHLCETYSSLYRPPTTTPPSGN